MARPKKEKELNHYHFVSVRLSDIELENVDKAATTVGLSRSEYIRRALLNQEISVRYEIVADMKELQKLVGEIGKIGSNLNQIAKHFNSGGSRSMAMEDEIRECISQLFKWRREIMRLAGDYHGSIETHKKQKR